jgi:acetylglutamate kinase
MVVKLGGNVVDDPRVAGSIATLPRTVVIHGGGAQVSALQERLGQTPRKVAGRRITDADTLSAFEMAIGKVNIDLCARLIAAGVLAVGLNGAIRADKRVPLRDPASGALVDLGFVGDVTSIDADLLRRLIDAGFTPVMPCVGISPDGTVYNINADVVANRVAVLLAAASLWLVSDVDGVRGADGQRIDTIEADEAQQLIDDSVVTDGMIPKLEESFAAIRDGVSQVRIVGPSLEGTRLR